MSSYESGFFIRFLESSLKLSSSFIGFAFASSDFAFATAILINLSDSRFSSLLLLSSSLMSFVFSLYSDCSLFSSHVSSIDPCSYSVFRERPSQGHYQSPLSFREISRLSYCFCVLDVTGLGALYSYFSMFQIQYRFSIWQYE